MAEVKRPKLISFGCERVNDKNTLELPKTVRISVVLTDSTEDKFPEFNYQDELLAVTKKCGKSPISKTNGLDPCNEDDEDVKRIAAQMEAKYGMGAAKKRKYRKDDFADIGMGYDESDSFIDNTDGYDEIIPKNVTAIHGGFYINCGALEFKADDAVSCEESSSSEDETQNQLHNRKRIIESSGASEDEASGVEGSQQPEKKQKLVNGFNGMQKAIKKRLFGHDKIKQIRKRRNSESKKTVRELLKDRRVDLNMPVSEFSETAEKKDTILPSSDIKKSADSVDNVIESVINSVVKTPGVETNVIKEANQISKTEVDSGLEVIHLPETELNDIVASSSMEYVQLPENLPSDIVQIIDSLKNAASSSTEGKVKFFTGSINLLLLKLEKKCKCLGRQSRNKVYEHLAPFVKCRKETLLKRAKNLIVIDEKKRIKHLLDKLKSIVDTAMPAILKTYEEDSKLVVQKKFSTDEDSNKNMRMPKRHFPWNEDTKKLLRDIVTLRKKCFLNEGKQKDSLEQNLLSFLKSEVRIIWPEGWMSMNSLIKYSNITKDKRSLEYSKKINGNSTPNAKDSFSTSGSNISMNSSSGLTITPVTTNVNKNSPLDVQITPITSNETIITRISNENINKSSVIIPVTPPESETNTLKPNTNSINMLLTNVHDDLDIRCISPKNNSRKKEDEPIKPKVDEIKIQEVEIIDLNDSPISITENPSLKTKNKDIDVKTEDSSTNISIIDLTDQPELVRKPGPKSKTKYYTNSSSNGVKTKSESSNYNEEFSGSLALNKIISDSLESDINKGRPVNSSASIINPQNSVVKNLSMDYSKSHITSNDYSKIKSTSDMSYTKSSHSKPLTSDHLKIKPSASDISNTKVSPSDLSKKKIILGDTSKTKTSTNDFYKLKQNDLLKTKSLANDLSKSTPINDVSNVKVLSEDVLPKVKQTVNDFPTIKPTNDFSSIKALAGETFKTKLSSNDLSKPKLVSNDLSKAKLPSNDLPKAKLSSNDLPKAKLSSNDLHKAKSSHDYNHTRSISEGDDIQKVMEGLMVLQKMASPIKPKDDVRSSAPASVINLNKGYSVDPRHVSNGPSSTPSGIRRNSSFQDAFQKQFIPDFNSMKANLAFPLKGNYSSISKYDHSNIKNNSTSSDRYLQNSNHMYTQQNANNKLKTMSCSSSQPVGAYSMLDDMYTNFLNEYGHSKTANSKSSTHQK